MVFFVHIPDTVVSSYKSNIVFEIKISYRLHPRNGNGSVESEIPVDKPVYRYLFIARTDIDLIFSVMSYSLCRKAACGEFGYALTVFIAAYPSDIVHDDHMTFSVRRKIPDISGMSISLDDPYFSVIIFGYCQTTGSTEIVQSVTVP